MNAMQYNAIQRNAMLCNTMQYNAMLCYAMQYNAIQHYAMLCNAMQVEEVEMFQQSDLLDEDVFILDVFSQLYVWVGTASNRYTVILLNLNFIQQIDFISLHQIS
jgi:hypothetical protein